MKKTAALVLALGTALAGSAYADAGKIVSHAPVIVKQTPAAFSVKAGAKITVTRSVEGFEEKIEVTPYTMLPAGIRFQMDSSFKAAVDSAKQSVTFAKQIKAGVRMTVTLQWYPGKTFNQVGVALQKEFTGLGYKRAAKTELRTKGKLPGTLVTYSGKKQDAGYTLYSLKGGILVEKHQYPKDAADGMEPLLAQLRNSLAVK